MENSLLRESSGFMFGEAFSELVAASLGSFDRVDDFQAFVRRFVRPVLPHGGMIAVLGRMTFEQVDVELIIPVDYSEALLSQVGASTNFNSRPVVERWLTEQQPMVIDLVSGEGLLSDLEKWEFETFGLERIAVHGQIDVSGRMASYFSFSHVPANDAGYVKRLEAAAPHIHNAFMKTVNACCKRTPPNLTRKELEILKWVIVGRTNKDIAIILDKSEMTVRNQVHNLLGKLCVANRSEAVLAADRLGLLTPWNRSFDPSH
jgi:DNA-binding CsgD family transcriptional regulator